MSRAGKNRDGKGRSVGIFSFMRFYGRTEWALFS